MEKSLGLPESLHNTPTKFTRSDFQSYVFPVLASLASYHTHMDPFFQQKVRRQTLLLILLKFFS